MTFPYKIKVDKCIGNCNDKNNPYFRVCLPDIIKNVTIKVFDLLSQKIDCEIFHFIKVVNADVY